MRRLLPFACTILPLLLVATSAAPLPRLPQYSEDEPGALSPLTVHGLEATSTLKQPQSPSSIHNPQSSPGWEQQQTNEYSFPNPKAVGPLGRPADNPFAFPNPHARGPLPRPKHQPEYNPNTYPNPTALDILGRSKSHEPVIPLEPHDSAHYPATKPYYDGTEELPHSSEYPDTSFKGTW